MSAKKIDINDLQPDQTEFLKLKDQCRTWTPKDWESHLQTLECPLNELLLSRGDLRIQSAPTAGVFEAVGSISESRRTLLKNLISTLTRRQQKIIRKIFFEGLSERQVARMMGISRQGVFDLKKRALRQLKIKAGKY